MVCAWKELVSLLPGWMQADVDRLGKSSMEELRLRINSPPQMILNRGVHSLQRNVTRDDLNQIVNAACRYSPWTAASTAMGYLTAPGGHRLGLCGEVVLRDGVVSGIRALDSICLRVSRDYPGCGKGCDPGNDSMLILGAPGWGKTTLLRDVARAMAAYKAVSVVDERQELFPPGYQRGTRMDVLLGCPKPSGMEMLLRTMGPQCIAVDEITSESDCEALIHAANCGVQLIASVHASGRSSLVQRPIYRRLMEQNIFRKLLILHPNRSFHMEEIP